MANTTFGNLKIKCLRRAGNNYNSGDVTLLTIAGGIINEVMGEIQSYIKGHPFTLDTVNTVSTVASQAYAALADTDIIEILQVYQRESKTKLKQITWQEYVDLLPDPTVFGGIPDLRWTAVQVVTAGVNTWSIYFIPTPSSVISVYYDYVKSLQFSADDSSANAEYSKLPSVYDSWIIAEFKPKLIEVMDPKNSTAILKAETTAKSIRTTMVQAIMSQVDRKVQVGSTRGIPFYRNPVPTITQQ